MESNNNSENSISTDHNNKCNNTNKILLLLICVLAAVAVIFSGFYIYKFINIKTHPTLPNGAKIGMSFEKFQKFDFCLTNLSTSNYDKTRKSYIIELSESYFSKSLDKLSKKETELKNPTAYFNEEKQLYKITYCIDFYSEEQSNQLINMLTNYYSKATGTSILYDLQSKKAILSDNKNEYSIIKYDSYVFVSLDSKIYKPHIVEISESRLKECFNQIEYSGGYYLKTNLYKLINECVTNQKITYEKYYVAKNSRIEEWDIKEFEEGKYGDYSSNAYYVNVHGDIHLNKKIANIDVICDKDTDVISLLLIFDDDGNYIDYVIISENSNLKSYYQAELLIK